MGPPTGRPTFTSSHFNDFALAKRHAPAYTADAYARLAAPAASGPVTDPAKRSQMGAKQRQSGH
ncbi:MAG TPA: hypothetical protein VGN31_18515 [Paraburkholderia sp.]|jgi:hypothetical protein